jgi:hypothetical protein
MSNSEKIVRNILFPFRKNLSGIHAARLATLPIDIILPLWFESCLSGVLKMVSKIKTLKKNTCDELKSACFTAWIRNDTGLKGMFIYAHHFVKTGEVSLRMSVNTKRETLTVANRGAGSTSAQFDTPFGVVKARVVNRRLFVSVPNGIELD